MSHVRAAGKGIGGTAATASTQLGARTVIGFLGCDGRGSQVRTQASTTIKGLT